MASNTKQTELRRKKKKRKSGRDRKRTLRVQGSTPSHEKLFAVVKE